MKPFLNIRLLLWIGLAFILAACGKTKPGISTPTEAVRSDTPLTSPAPSDEPVLETEPPGQTAPAGNGGSQAEPTGLPERPTATLEGSAAYPAPVSGASTAYPLPDGQPTVGQYVGPGSPGSDPSVVEALTPLASPARVGGSQIIQTQVVGPAATLPGLAPSQQPGSKKTPAPTDNGTRYVTMTPLPTWTRVPTPGPSLTPTPSPSPVSTETPTLGPLLPTLTVQMFATDPTTVTLASGKVQFLMFFAFWCGTCKEMMPVIQSLAAQFQGKINFIYLDIDNPATEGFRKTLGYHKQPEYFLLGPQGKVLGTWQGIVDVNKLKPELEGALKP